MTPTSKFLIERSPWPLTPPLQLQSCEFERSSSSLRFEPTSDSAPGSFHSYGHAVERIDSNFRSDLG